MDIYSASHGGVVQLDHQLSEYPSLQDLYEDIAPVTEVDVSDILLFMEDGRELKQQVLEEIYARGGEAGPSMPTRENFFLFDKRSFSADPDEWASQLHEDVQLPPQLNLSALNDVTSAQTPFLIAQDHILHLQSLYTTQSKALQIAYQNLLHHTTHLRQTFSSFARTAEANLDSQERLIKSAKGDMAMLPKVVVHEAVMRVKDRAGVEVGGKKTMGDWVNVKKMEQVKEACRSLHEAQVDRFNDVATQIEDLLLQSESERGICEERSRSIGQEFTHALARIEMALEHVGELLARRSEGVIQDLIALDQAMRDDLVALTEIKNEYTHDVHVYLSQVVHLQGRIPAITPLIQILEEDIGKTDPMVAASSFNHLHRLHRLPVAYASTVIEVVRRKEISTFLIEWVGRFLNVISRFTDEERRRRREEGIEGWGLLPWDLNGMMGSDGAVGPKVDITVVGGAEKLEGARLGRTDIDDLVRWAESLKYDKDILAAVEDGDTSPIEYLQAGLDDLISKMSVGDVELNKMIERSVLLKGTLESQDMQAGQGLSDQLRAAEEDKTRQAQHIAEMEDTHNATIRELSQRHEQRTSALQTRQAELQEELVRLRTDLGEEMIARQALSTQLEEHAREQDERQREFDDQAELLVALQAELAQEKDRATDLGVRLQEALLDVDGLRNAEQALVAQIQGLQDERSSNMRLIGESHNEQRNLESQLAGLRAELETTATQLMDARVERDAALRNQRTEAEKMIRDHIAATDGDRAVLEGQNLTLTKQLEDLRVASDEKLGAAKNAALREVGGLQAELKLTKAQLRDIQRRETVLADELAMARDNALAMSSKKGYQADVSKDAVALVTRYHETCQRLQTLINNSSTISGTGSGSTLITKVPIVSQNIQPEEDLRESVMIKSLETASGFDLAAFSEAVQKTIVLVKKWSRSCKTYRDSAKNKISFSNFSKGDLALFLPTRNAAAKSWAAFNIAAPHNFLALTDTIQNQVGSREYIIARIVSTDEAVAAGGESPESNPFGLADGLRYYVHHVEEYNPSAPPRPSRRSTSATYQASSAPLETGASEMIASTPTVRREITTSIPPITPVRPHVTSYFPTMPEAASLDKAKSAITAPGDVQGEEDDSTPSNPTPESSDQNSRPIMSSPPSLPGSFGPATSPVKEDLPSPTRTILPSPPRTTVLQQSQRDMSESSLSSSRPSNAQYPRLNTPEPDLHPLPTTSSPAFPTKAPQDQTRTHQRTPSHLSSPPNRDRETPKFAPSSLGRPASVASSISSYPRAGTTPPGVSAGKSAPAMAVTTSNSPGSSSGLDTHALGASLERRVIRKGSSQSLLPMKEELLNSSPLASIGTTSESSKTVRVQGFSTAGSGLGPTSTVEQKEESRGTGSKLMRGFSMRKKSTTEGQEAKASAMDMLRRFENGG